jgi:uncharacterized protein YbjT (DUF2867 family)
MILIVGGSGHLGRATARRLLAQGKEVRIMTRNPAAVADLTRQGAQVVEGDLRNSAQIQGACRGAEQVLAAAHALNGKGGNNPASVDDLGNRHLIAAAGDAGVKHFIFISIQGAGPEHPIEFFRIKYTIEEYLRASGLSYTILRPSAYMDLWGELIGEPILKQGKVTIFGSGENPINFISVDDVAEMICLALADPRALNRSIDLGGPENLTMNQVAGIFETLRGQEAEKRHVPLAAMRVMSVIMRPLNPALARLIRNSVFMDRADLRFDPAETNREFPLPLTRFEDWSRAHFGQAATRGKIVSEM